MNTPKLFLRILTVLMALLGSITASAALPYGLGLNTTKTIN